MRGGNVRLDLCGNGAVAGGGVPVRASLIAPLAIAAVVAAGVAAGKAAQPLALPFIENDHAAAVAKAKTAARPLFVEVWAPW